MSNFIEVYEDVLTPEQCQQIIDAFEKSRNTVPGVTSGGLDPSKKLSKDLYLNQHPEYADILRMVVQAVTDHMVKYFDKYYFSLIGPFGLTVYHPKTGEPVALTAKNFEEVGRPQVSVLMKQLFRLGHINAQKYDQGKGGYPYWHSECYPQKPDNDALHRILAFTIYLNDVEAGGETEFVYQGVKLAPKTGTMSIFPAYFTHTHRGNVPESGDKYILTSWVLFNRAEQIYGA